jgi:hypothetical protein
VFIYNHIKYIVLKSIAMITANHGREQILELYCLGIERLRKQCPNITIHSVIVGDEQDVTPRYDCIHVPYKNTPVSDKFNVACRKARELGVDNVIVMGSDDIMNNVLFDTITSRSEDFVAIRDIYLYSLDKACQNELRYVKTNMVGCARMLSKEMLDHYKIEWSPWMRPRDWGLDQILLHTVLPYAKSQYIFTAKDVGGACVDIKNEWSMNKFAKWKGLEKCDPKVILDWLSQEEKDLITKIINQ